MSSSSDSGKAALGGLTVGALLLKLCSHVDDDALRGCSRVIRPSSTVTAEHVLASISQIDDGIGALSKSGARVEALTHEEEVVSGLTKTAEPGADVNYGNVDAGRGITVGGGAFNRTGEFLFFSDAKRAAYDEATTRLGNMNSSNRHELARIINTTLHDQLKALLENLEVYNAEKKSLQAAFGNNHQLVKAYDEGFSNTIFSGTLLNRTGNTLLIESLKEGRKRLLPKQLRNLTGHSYDSYAVNDLYALLMGVKLTQKQAVVLSKITKRKIGASSNKYDDYLFISSNFINDTGLKLANAFNVSTTTTSTIRVPKDIKALKSFSKKGVIVDGKIDHQLAKKLSKSGFKFVSNFERLTSNLTVEPRKVKLIFVASEDQTKLSQLFEVTEDQASDLIQTISKIKDAPNSVIVDSQEALEKALLEASLNNQEHIVIFNNTEGRIFDKEVRDYNIREVITCNSYTIDNASLNTNSTDFIYVKEVINSLLETHTDESLYPDEFMYKFSLAYNMKLSERSNKTITVTVVVGVTATGGVGAIAYYNTHK